MPQSGNKPGSAFYAARAWSIRQRDLARASAAATPRAPDTRLADLRTLATSLEAFPHMSSTLATVRAQIEAMVRAGHV
jgi:hypothetical protein